MSIDFKGSHYPKDVILYAVFFYVRYAVSYRDLEEILAERGVYVEHATLSRWVVKYAPLIAGQADIRRMLIIGAMSRINWLGQKTIQPGSWLARLLARKPRMLVAIALANKMARQIWAMLSKGEDFKVPGQAVAG